MVLSHEFAPLCEQNAITMFMPGLDLLLLFGGLLSMAATDSYGWIDCVVVLVM